MDVDKADISYASGGSNGIKHAPRKESMVAQPADIVKSNPRIMLLLNGYIRSSFNDSSDFIDIIHLIYSFYHLVNTHPQPMNIDIINASTPSKDSERKKSSKLIIDPSELLIIGYIRTNNSKITTEIAELICDFYFRMNSQSFVWKITNQKRLLTKILNTTANNTGFESDVFSIQPKINYNTDPSSSSNHAPLPFSRSLSASHIELDNLSLKWYLKLYPSLNGQFEIEIILISLPSILKNILFIYQIYCHELSSFWSSQMTFNDTDETRKYISPSLANSNHDPNSLASILYLDEINKQTLDSLTFFCNFDIIRVGMSKGGSSSRSRERRSRRLEYKYNPRYYFDESKYFEAQRDGKNDGKFMMLTDEFRFRWNLHEYHLSDLCNWPHSQNQKCIISDVYQSMWCLSIKYQNDTDTIAIGMALCSLPSNISSIVVQIKLECLQLSLSWSVVRKFDYEQRYRCVNDTDVSINDLEKVAANNNKLSILAHIVVIEAFDQNKEEMSLIQKQQQQQNMLYPNLSSKSKFPTQNTRNYNFEPMTDVGHNKNVTRYYQHICISHDAQFEEVSQEELRIQDVGLNKLTIASKGSATASMNRMCAVFLGFCLLLRCVLFVYD